jgi:hypothetical protein
MICSSSVQRRLGDRPGAIPVRQELFGRSDRELRRCRPHPQDLVDPVAGQPPLDRAGRGDPPEHRASPAAAMPPRADRAGLGACMRGRATSAPQPLSDPSSSVECTRSGSLFRTADGRRRSPPAPSAGRRPARPTRNSARSRAGRPDRLACRAWSATFDTASASGIDQRQQFWRDVAAAHEAPDQRPSCTRIEGLEEISPRAGSPGAASSG